MGLSQQPSSSRRAFLNKAVLGGAGAIAGVAFNGSAAIAYERREVGGDDRSATTTAMNNQAYETNNRLEKSGFKLDTREEETAKLSSALSSFSYESSSTSKKTGYRTQKTAEQPKSKD